MQGKKSGNQALALELYNNSGVLLQELENLMETPIHFEGDSSRVTKGQGGNHRDKTAPKSKRENMKNTMGSRTEAEKPVDLARSSFMGNDTFVFGSSSL